MGYIRLPLGIRVAMEYEMFGKIIVNVYHVRTTDPIITLKLFDIAEVFATWWDLHLSQAATHDIGLNSVTALNLDVPNGEKVTYVVSPTEPGKDADDGMSANVSLVQSYQTALTGRSFQGRSYFCGLTESQVTGNEVTPTLAAALVTVQGQLMSLLVAENALLLVASFQSGGLPRAEGIGTPVESVSVNTRVDTQRRRLPKS